MHKMLYQYHLLVLSSHSEIIPNQTAGGDPGNKVNRGPRNDRPAYDKDRGVKFNEEEREERNNRRNREDGGRLV